MSFSTMPEEMKYYIAKHTARQRLTDMRDKHNKKKNDLMSINSFLRHMYNFNTREQFRNLLLNDDADEVMRMINNREEALHHLNTDDFIKSELLRIQGGIRNLLGNLINNENNLPDIFINQIEEYLNIANDDYQVHINETAPEYFEGGQIKPLEQVLHEQLPEITRRIYTQLSGETTRSGEFLASIPPTQGLPNFF